MADASKVVPTLVIDEDLLASLEAGQSIAQEAINRRLQGTGISGNASVPHNSSPLETSVNTWPASMEVVYPGPVRVEAYGSYLNVVAKGPIEIGSDGFLQRATSETNVQVHEDGKVTRAVAPQVDIHAGGKADWVQASETANIQGAAGTVEAPNVHVGPESDTGKILNAQQVTGSSDSPSPVEVSTVEGEAYTLSNVKASSAKATQHIILSDGSLATTVQAPTVTINAGSQAIGVQATEVTMHEGSTANKVVVKSHAEIAGTVKQVVHAPDNPAPNAAPDNPAIEIKNGGIAAMAKAPHGHVSVDVGGKVQEIVISADGQVHGEGGLNNVDGIVLQPLVVPSEELQNISTPNTTVITGPFTNVPEKLKFFEGNSNVTLLVDPDLMEHQGMEVYERTHPPRGERQQLGSPKLPPHVTAAARDATSGVKEALSRLSSSSPPTSPAQGRGR